ncbi:DNA alkylation repair protein [bacterium]|nr:DNA alkylation repair protein [bacterium]
MVKDIRIQLEYLAESDYQKFSASLLPNVKNVLGVRLPILRKLAKNISISDWQSFLNITPKYMEEVMLQGMVIGLVAKSSQDLQLIKDFVVKIDNWSVCDSFCCGLKFVKFYKQDVFDFLQPYLKSKKEYELRFGFVMLLNYYVEEYYLDKIVAIVDEFSSKDYYAQMAVAWLVSVCYIKYPELSEEYLKKSKLDDFTYNKSIQKIIESNRIEKSEKQRLKKYKR